MKRFAQSWIAICLLLTFSTDARAQLSQCSVTATIHDSQGALLSGFRLTVVRVIKNGQVISASPKVYTTNSSGVATLTLPRASTAYIYANAFGLDRLGSAGVPLYVPDSSSANLEQLANISTLFSSPYQLIYSTSGNVPAALSPNTSTTPKFLTSLGDGTNATRLGYYSILGSGSLSTSVDNTAKTVTFSYAPSASDLPSGIDAAKIGGGTVSNTEFGYLDGVSSAIQTQLDAKLPLTGGTLTGNLTLAGAPSQNLHAATKLYVDTAVASASVADGDKGDITVSGSGTTWTIDNGTVTNAKLAGSIAASKLVGTDIATVGTITAGVWNGTAIGDSYISSAATWNAKVSATRAINTGTGLSGGGDLSSDRTLSLANTAVTAGSYTSANITVDAQGRITAASNGSGASVAGSNKQIQFNNSSAFGGAAGFEYQSAASPNVLIQAQNSAYVPLVLRLASGQTANALEAQNSTGTALTAITNTGTLTVGSTWDGSSATPEGLVFLNTGGAGNDIYLARDTSNNLILNTANGSALSFRVAGSEKLAITSTGLSLPAINLTGTGAINAITGVVFSDVGGTGNDVGIWRDSATGRAVFYHAGSSGAHNLTIGDTTMLQVDESATADDVRLLLWDVSAATLKRVVRGAADSCGTGFRCLRIAN